jgi:outer membrane protein TolC
MKYSIVYILACFLVGIQNLQAESIETYLQVAAENNPELKAKYAEFEMALEQVIRANDLPDPQLSFGYFILPVETRIGAQNAKIGLSQMFPWFGTLKVKSSVASQTAEAKYQLFLDTRNKLYSKVKTIWYELFEVNRMIQLQEENKAILLSYKQLSETAFKNGKSSMVDVIRVDMAINDVDEKLSVLRMKIKPIETRFNTLLNRELPSKVIAPLSLKVDDIQSYSMDSILRHPKLNSIHHRIKSSKGKMELTKKLGMPQFGVGLDYVIIGERTDMNVEGNGRDVLMPMISMTIPINRSKYKSYQKEASLEQDMWGYLYEQTKNELRSKYEMIFFQLNKSNSLINLCVEQIEQAEQAIRILLKAYSVSGKDFEEVLKMQQALLKYQMEKTTALKQYHIAKAEMDYLLSK